MLNKILINKKNSNKIIINLIIQACRPIKLKIIINTNYLKVSAKRNYKMKLLKEIIVKIKLVLNRHCNNNLIYW